MRLVLSLSLSLPPHLFVLTLSPSSNNQVAVMVAETDARFIAQSNPCVEIEALTVPGSISATLSEENAATRPGCFESLTENLRLFRVVLSSSPLQDGLLPQSVQVTARTCGSCFDTLLFVLNDQDPDADCFDFDFLEAESQCISLNDDQPLCSLSLPPQNPCSSFSPLTSELSWCATRASYLVAVASTELLEEAAFTLSVSVDGQCASPSNDKCEDAILLPTSELVQEKPLIVRGSTVLSTGESRSCGDFQEGFHSVWYRIEGDSSSFTLSLCNPDTSFDATIGVFSSSLQQYL